MPTKSNNTGGRGGARPGAGRKKSAVKDKAENGNPGGRKLEVLDIPEVEGVDMPKPHDFLSAEQRDGSVLQAQEIYTETWQWLKGIGCAAKVSPQLLERYAMCSARWVQCEEMTNRMGFLSKHPTTQKPIPSPFINIGINYMNQAVRLWNEIFQIVCPIKAICNRVSTVICAFFISFTDVMDAVFNLQTTIMLFQMQVSFGCKQPSKVIGSILISVSFILRIRQKILLHTVRHSIIVIFVFQLFF